MEKYSISVGHNTDTASPINMTECPEDAVVKEMLDVEVTKEMFLSLSRGNMMVAVSPQSGKSCQVSYIS